MRIASVSLEHLHPGPDSRERTLLLHFMQRRLLPVHDENHATSLILDYIDFQLCDPTLSEERISNHFGLSRATLYRRFRAHGGIASYIRERRLHLAYHHLSCNPSCNLTWLLYEIGFRSERQFQRAFHTRFGMSAAQWRRNCQASKASSAPEQATVFITPNGTTAGECP